MSKRIAGSNERIGLEDTVFANYPDYVPDEVKFGEIKKALAAKRTPIIIRSENVENATNTNRRIQIKLPNSAILNTRKGFLKFTVELTAAGSTYKRLHSNVACIFNRLVVRNGTSTLQDSKDINRLSLLMWEAFNNPDMSGELGMSCGFGTQVERNAAGAIITSYSCPLYGGLFSKEMLPLRDLKNPIEIDLYLEEPSAIMETDSVSTLIIRVTNFEFHVERYDLDQAYTDFISSYIKSNGLRLGFHSFERYQNLVTASTSQNLIINHRTSSLNGIINVFVDSTQLNSPTVNDRLITWLPRGLATSQVDINGKLFPDEAIDTLSVNRWDAYQGYLRWANRWHIDGMVPEVVAPINSTAFAIDRFLQLDDFEPYPENAENIINPFTTLENSANIRKKYTFSVAPPANTLQLDSYCEFFTEVNISSDGLVQVNE